MIERDELDGTLAQFFEVIYRRHRLAGKSPESAKNFRVQISHLRRFLRREPMLADLTDEAIIDCMQQLLEQGRSRATCNKVHTHLTAIWNFAARKGLTEGRFPTVRKFSEPERAPQAWNEHQLRLLFFALARVQGTIRGLPANEWHVCHHIALWYTAERLRASLLIRVDDFNQETGWLRIRAESRKGQTRDLMRRLPPAVLPRLRLFVAHDPGRKYLFPIDCHESTLFNRYKLILKSAGLPHGRESMYHRMRRSAISHFKRLGGDGTALADHSNPNITRRSYEDPTIVSEQQAADLLFLPFPDDDDGDLLPAA